MSFCVWVSVNETPVLLLDEEGCPEVLVKSRVLPISCTEGLSHVAEGTLDCARSKGWLIVMRVLCSVCVFLGEEQLVSEKLSKGREEDVPLPP